MAVEPIETPHRNDRHDLRLAGRSLGRTWRSGAPLPASQAPVASGSTDHATASPGKGARMVLAAQISMVPISAKRTPSARPPNGYGASSDIPSLTPSVAPSTTPPSFTTYAPSAAAALITPRLVRPDAPSTSATTAPATAPAAMP